MSPAVNITSLPHDVLGQIVEHLHEPMVHRKDGGSYHRQDFQEGQRRVAKMMTVCKLFNRIAAPVLYRRVQTTDLLHTMTGINKRGVTGCPSKLKLCGMIQYLHLEYPGRRREDDPQMYLRTLSHAEYSAFWKTCTGYAPENRIKLDKHSATLLKAAFAGRAASTVFPTLEWLSFASIGDVEGRATAGSSVRLDMLAPKHICIVSSPFFMPRRQDYSATWPDNISKYLQVNTKHQKVAHTDAPTTTETLTVHFDDNVEFRGALRLSLPHGLTRYLLPLPTLQIGLSATNRAKTIGEWFFELMNPKVWPSEQYAFAFYIQCPPTTTEKGKAYRNRMKEILAEWMDKAKDREAARQKRAGLADEEWEELVIEWDLLVLYGSRITSYGDVSVDTVYRLWEG